jgi:trigger factor
MNIEKKTIDAVNAVLTIQIAQADYQEKIDKSLRDYRKKANVPGFRPGMVPVGLLKKMYGKAILAEEVNKLVSDGLYNYIKDNELSILGEPLPSEGQEMIDFETEQDFSFSFDLGLAPELKPELSKKDKIKYYTINPDEKMIENQIKSYTGRFGSYLQEEIVEGKDMVKGNLVELDAEGKAVENGISIEAAVLTPDFIKDKKIKAKFVGAKKGDIIVFNPQKAFDKNEAEISSLLKIQKEEVANVTADFSITIDGITRYQEAEMNQELFDKVFGEGAVKSEEEFKTKIIDGLKETLSTDSEYKFSVDAKEALVKKADKLVFPEAFLKRWVLETNKDMTVEALNEQFDKMLEDLKWHITKDKLAKENDIKVEAADVDTFAKKVAKAQFAQYGMLSVPDDVLDGYSKDMMKNQDTVRNMYEKVVEEKVFDIIKGAVTLNTVEISIDEFNKMFEEK